MTTLSAVSREVDCRQWIDATQRLGRRLISTAEPQARPILEWRLAMALSDCVAIEQAQGRSNEALKLGEYAGKLLRSCGAAGDQIPAHDFLAGRLYYRLGAISAIELADHKLAMTWYERAVPLLESPVPSADFSDEARHGDMFVSMAVSYWELGRRDQALRLTKQGARLIERAVADGIVARKVLAVPYGNLATMFTDLGDETQAREYAELASRSEHTGISSKGDGLTR
jgi:tetratricopeptide (TPR) repeat protein